MFLMGFLLFSPIMSYAEEIDKEEQEKVVEEKVTLEECVDINTAKFRTSSNSIIKVRFLALNIEDIDDGVSSVETPILKEAKEYTCNRITNASKIELEFDDNSDKKDKYNRYLAWVYVDDSLLEEELVQNGLAKVAYLYGDYSYTDKLKETEEEAKENKVGMYSDVDNSYYTTNKNNENSKTNLDDDNDIKSFTKFVRSNEK